MNGRAAGTTRPIPAEGRSVCDSSIPATVPYISGRHPWEKIGDFVKVNAVLPT